MRTNRGESVNMQTGGWKTKNWSDFTCYTSDGSSALTMEPITEEEDLHRWSIYGSTPDRTWVPAIHNMEHGVFMAKRAGILLEGDIEQMELQGDTLICRGHLREGESLLADCEARIKLSQKNGLEIFSVTYLYQFLREGPYEVLQQYNAPGKSSVKPDLLLPAEGCGLSWDEENGSLQAGITVDQPVEKKAEFTIGFHVNNG